MKVGDYVALCHDDADFDDFPYYLMTVTAVPELLQADETCSFGHQFKAGDERLKASMPAERSVLPDARL